MACLSLKGMLPWVFVGAISQEVPLVDMEYRVRLYCKGTVLMVAESKPYSSLQI